MDTLLANNDDFALIGDMEGRIRTEQRPADLSLREWKERLRSSCLEPEHWYKDEDGVPYKRITGNYTYEKDGRITAQSIEGVKSYESFTDEVSGLSIRFTFFAYSREWFIADREPDDNELYL